MEHFADHAMYNCVAFKSSKVKEDQIIPAWITLNLQK